MLEMTVEVKHKQTLFQWNFLFGNVLADWYNNQQIPLPMFVIGGSKNPDQSIPSMYMFTLPALSSLLTHQIAFTRLN